MHNLQTVPSKSLVFQTVFGFLACLACACSNPASGSATNAGDNDAFAANDTDAAGADSANAADQVADASAGGFFLVGHAEAYAKDSKATAKITFSVVDDEGKQVPVTVRTPAPDYRLEVPPPKEYPHYYTPSFALEGLPSVTANNVYKPGFSGTPDSDTAGVQQVEMTRGTPIAVCGILAISPYDGTLLARGLNQWQRVRAATDGLETTPIAGSEMSGNPPNTQQGGGPIEACVGVSGQLNATFLPGGRFALVPEPMKTGGGFSYAVFDVQDAKLPMHIATSGAPLKMGQNQQFALIDEPQTYTLTRLRWDKGQVTAQTIEASAAVSSPEGRFFLQSQQKTSKYVRYDADTQATTTLLESMPPLLAHTPLLGTNGEFLVWGEQNEELLGPKDCTMGYSTLGCTLRLVQPGGQPVTVTTQSFDYAVSVDKRVLVYVTPTALMRYDVDTATATSVVTLKYDPNESFGLFNPGVAGALVVGNHFVVRDGNALHVVEMNTGTVVKTLPGFWSTILPFHEHAVTIKGICQLGRNKDPAYCAQGILDTQTGEYTDTRNLYANGKRTFTLEQGILQIGDAADPNGQRDVIFPAYGFPELAADFKGSLTWKAPCVPYIRPPAGKLNGIWTGYDTLCVW